ncbi:DUF5008 domain-containing protein [Sphingobacterium puteale]|uniref:DUF5008 domain-containing protein n=1 Tax=Sphingobacterium puteale TaxID=2420510 RepID=UPI003D989BD3
MLKYRKYKVSFLVAICWMALIASCSKSKELAEDPYAGGKQVLPISFVSKTTDPDIVDPGYTLDLKVNGLLKFKDKFKLYINEIEAEVVNFSDSTIRFIVPEKASTGSIWITVDEQTFFGPIIKIGGKVAVDQTFKIVNGAGRLSGSGQATVFDAEQLPNGRFWLVGAFDNFELKGTELVPNGGIAQIDGAGAYSTSDINFGKGVFGGMKTIYSINRINNGTQNGSYIIAGNFSAYNSTRSNRQTISNITRLTAKGELDTIVTNAIVNPKPSETWKNIDTVPSFNGGVDGVIRKTFIFDEKIYAVGNFQNYRRIYYPNSTYDDKVYDVTRMLQMVRMNMDGSMDSTFHYNESTHQSAMAGNGVITDAMMQSDGKLVLVGNFTTFNGISANRIVRINLDGSVDHTFQAGTGADGDIYSIRYSENSKKIILSGVFKSFNGKSASGITLLNADGSLDNTFRGEEISGGSATFAAQLNSGKILVTGSFNKYGDYLRQGFMVLNPDGTLAQGYNNTGGFQGRVYDMIESLTSAGSQVVLVGDIIRFNSMLPHNVLRIDIEN